MWWSALEIVVPTTGVTLPRYSDPAFAGITLTAVGELAIEARIQPGVWSDGELGAGVDARGVARGARTIDRERGTGQRDEGGIDRASGIELVHPRQPRVRRQRHSIGKSEPGIELSAQEGRKRGHADRAVGQAERARGAERHWIRLGEAVLPQFGELHGRKRRDREAAEHLLCAHFHAAAEEIAAEAARRRLGRANAGNAARLAVAERAEAQRASRIDGAPRFHPVAAEVRPLEMAAGDAVADREIRAAAADSKAKEHIGGELIIEPAREPAGVVGEVGAADSCFARKLEGAIKAGKTRPPARLGGRGRGHLL